MCHIIKGFFQCRGPDGPLFTMTKPEAMEDIVKPCVPIRSHSRCLAPKSRDATVLWLKLLPGEKSYYRPEEGGQGSQECSALRAGCQAPPLLAPYYLLSHLQ